MGDVAINEKNELDFYETVYTSPMNRKRNIFMDAMCIVMGTNIL